MNKNIILPSLAGVILTVSLLMLINEFSPRANAYSINARPAPEFTQTSPDAWLGSKPLKMSDLRGKVVLIDFWTYGCWNCYRSFPWLNNLEARYSDKDFQVIGIHTPEFDHEKIRENVVKKIKEFDLKHPSMMDNDFAFWRRMGNRYWPTYYLIDKRGYIRYFFIGETHKGTARALEIESALMDLLAEQ